MRSLQSIARSRIARPIAALLASLVLGGCAATGGYTPGQGGKYQYTYAMVAPSNSADLTHRDERIIIQFRPDDAAMKFQLQNLSDGELSIDWGRASIGVEGRFYPVRHAMTLYGDSARGSMLLPPMGYMRDLVIPAENIRFDGEQWVETDLLPTMDRGSDALRTEIRGSVGKQVSVILPLLFGQDVVTYEFAFRVASVRSIAWRDFRPVERVPAPPVIKRKSGKLDQMTVAVIAIGLLGFATFVLSQSKNPPSE
jgi:hypothetical protein